MTAVDSPDSGGYTVRRAASKDIPIIIQFWHAMRLEAGLGDHLLVNGWYESMAEFLVEQIRAESTVVWLAEVNETPVGSTLVTLKRDFPFFLFAPTASSAASILCRPCGDGELLRTSSTERFAGPRSRGRSMSGCYLLRHRVASTNEVVSGRCKRTLNCVWGRVPYPRSDIAV